MTEAVARSDIQFQAFVLANPPESSQLSTNITRIMDRLTVWIFPCTRRHGVGSWIKETSGHAHRPGPVRTRGSLHAGSLNE